MTADDSNDPVEAKQPDVLEVVDEAAQGVVQWYGLAKGYGFVIVAGIEENIFVHHSQLTDPDNLMAGDKVRFRLVRTVRGLQAQDLEILVEAEAKPETERETG